MRLDEIKSEPLVLYHGDDFGTTRLLPQLMFHGGNNQEGVGIYFSKYRGQASAYGSKICKTVLTSMTNIVHSRSTTYEVLDAQTGSNFIYILNEQCPKFWKIFSPYGIKVNSANDVTEEHCITLYDEISETQMRDFQIQLCHYSGDTTRFVNAWNTSVPIRGVYEPTNAIFCLIDTKIKVTPVNF